LRILSTKGASPYPKFLVLGCNGRIEIVDHAFSLTEATIRVEKEDACYVLKILRIKEGEDLVIFDIEEVPVSAPARRPVPVSRPVKEAPLPPLPVVALPARPTRGARPPPVELL
jgi:hypothetical protein